MEQSDLEIIEKIKKGEIQSFEEIVKRYQDKVFRLCVSFLGERGAEDAAQEVFVRIYESLEKFQGTSAFSTWLYRVAVNHCLNLISKRKRERTESLDELIEKHGDKIHLLFKNQPSVPNQENKQIIETVLNRLSSDEKAILILREMEGLNYKELSETLNISMDTVKVRLFRARKSLLYIALKHDPASGTIKKLDNGGRL